MRQIDRVLDDVALVGERRIDVDRRIGDQQRAGIVRRVDRIDMADTTCGAETAGTIDHRVHQLVGVQRALHHRLDLAGSRHRHPGFGSSRTVLDRDDLITCKINRSLGGGGADLGFRSDQHRHDQPLARRLDSAEQRGGIHRMHHRGSDRLQPACHFDQPLVALSGAIEIDFRQQHPRPRNLLDRRDHFGEAGDHLFAALIGGAAIQQQAFLGRVLLFDRDRDGHGVAEQHGPCEPQRLIEIDRARSGQLRAEQGRDQRPAPHAVRHHLMKHVTLGESRVDMHRVDVAGHHREHLDVAIGQRPNQTGGVTDFDLIEGTVLDLLHHVSPASSDQPIT